MLVEKLWSETISKVNEEIKIVDYAIGAKYSYAIVEGKHGRAMGAAYVPLEDIGKGHSRVPKISIVESMLSSTNIFEKSLGVAILNALSQYLLWNMGKSKNFKITYENIIEEVAGMCKGCKTVVVGNMVPVVSRLKEMGVDVVSLERNPKFRAGAMADIFAPRIVPEAEALIITGTTLINDTLDYILSLAERARVVALVGPSGSVYPSDILEGITHIAGLKIEDMEKVAEIIKLGGGRWDFSKYAKEYIIQTFREKV